jgi:predicted secreted Zn-dependent protease
MVDRRAFLTGSLLAAALAPWPVRGVARAPARSAVDVPRSSIALVDRSVAGSAAAVAHAHAHGLRVVEFAGDVASAWMRELEPRLRAGPLTIVGHTSAATFFCLDFLARDYGARTARRAERGAAVSFVISQHLGRRAALAPAAVRAQWSHSDA